MLSLNLPRSDQSAFMISEKDGLLHVSGPMDQQTATRLLEEGADLVRSADQAIDFSAVGKVDSSGLAVLLEWLRIARSAGHRLQMLNVPVAFTSLAHLYGVTAIVFPSDTGSVDSVKH